MSLYIYIYIYIFIDVYIYKYNYVLGNLVPDFVQHGTDVVQNSPEYSRNTFGTHPTTLKQYNTQNSRNTSTSMTTDVFSRGEHFVSILTTFDKKHGPHIAAQADPQRAN